MKRSIRQRLEQRKRRIERRLAQRRGRKEKMTGFCRPVMDTRSVKYELSQRSRGVVYGGVALLHRLYSLSGVSSPSRRSDSKRSQIESTRPQAESPCVAPEFMSPDPRHAVVRLVNCV